jgi:hypothetical protein
VTNESDDARIGIDGVIEWRGAEGELHRVDGPARVFPSGREEWFDHGRLHRTDGPAVIHANGSVKYYVDGVRHRVGGPACVYVNGTEKWYREGKRHRDDGPAAIYPDGRRIWFIEGEKVREERSARQPSLVKSEIDPTVRSAALQQEPAPHRLASQPHKVAVAEFREPRDKARRRAKPVIDRLGDRRQQLLGIGLLLLLLLSHPLFWAGFDRTAVG